MKIPYNTNFFLIFGQLGSYGAIIIIKAVNLNNSLRIESGGYEFCKIGGRRKTPNSYFSTKNTMVVWQKNEYFKKDINLRANT